MLPCGDLTTPGIFYSSDLTTAIFSSSPSLLWFPAVHCLTVEYTVLNWKNYLQNLTVYKTVNSCDPVFLNGNTVKRNTKSQELAFDYDYKYIKLVMWYTFILFGILVYDLCLRVATLCYHYYICILNVITQSTKFFNLLFGHLNVRKLGKMPVATFSDCCSPTNSPPKKTYSLFHQFWQGKAANIKYSNNWGEWQIMCFRVCGQDTTVYLKNKTQRLTCHWKKLYVCWADPRDEANVLPQDSGVTASHIDVPQLQPKLSPELVNRGVHCSFI